jgi:hypothetical protein
MVSQRGLAVGSSLHHIDISRCNPILFLLVVTIHAKKCLFLRGRHLGHHLFPTAGADYCKGFLEPPPFVILPGNVSPSSGHLYHLITIAS